jgi:glycosyltransferase involved in cell wall biosynthesis
MTTGGQKIRIAVIVPRLEALGPVIVMQNLVNSLFNNEEFSVKVFYLDSKGDSKVRMLVPVERLETKKFRFTDFDIVHTSGIRPDLFAFVNRKRIRYHISTVHNLVFEDFNYSYNSLVSWLFGNIWLMLWKRADKLVCVSGSVKNYYAKWLPVSKLEVIYNGIAGIDNSVLPDNDLVRTINDFHAKGLKVIGSAAIISKRKGLDQVLNLIASEKNLALVIIGDGKELSNLKCLAEKLHISDRCEFCGFRSNAVVYFKYLDYFIMPSLSEGFGLALIDAVEQRIPVICSDIDVFRELFTGDELTFFKSGNQTDLSSALRIASETGKTKTERAHTRYENSYTASSMARNYFELYKSVYQL